MGTPIVHPALPMLRRAERNLANLISGGLDQLAPGSEEASDIMLQLQDAGLEHIAAALQRAMESEDRAQRAGNILRAFAALGIVRSRLAEGISANLSQVPLLSEDSRLYIPPLPAGASPERLESLLALLAGQDVLHRAYAAERIPAFGDEAISRLLALIQKPKQEAGIKRLAARCITQMETPAAAEALVRLTEVVPAWREVYDALMRRGQQVIEPLQKALSNPSAGGAWLMAKVLWRLGAKDALHAAYVAATTPKEAPPEASEEAKSGKGSKAKAKKAEKPKLPEVHKAFESYHAALSLTKEQVAEMAAGRKYYTDETQRTIIMLLGFEQGWVTQDDFLAMLDNQQRNELRVSLRHVYDTPAHALALDHFQRMQRAATKHDDTMRARIGISILSDEGLSVLSEPEEDED